MEKWEVKNFWRRISCFLEVCGGANEGEKEEKIKIKYEENKKLKIVDLTHNSHSSTDSTQIIIMMMISSEMKYTQAHVLESRKKIFLANFWEFKAFERTWGAWSKTWACHANVFEIFLIFRFISRIFEVPETVRRSNFIEWIMQKRILASKWRKKKFLEIYFLFGCRLSVWWTLLNFSSSFNLMLASKFVLRALCRFSISTDKFFKISFLSSEDEIFPTSQSSDLTFSRQSRKKRKLMSWRLRNFLSFVT